MGRTDSLASRFAPSDDEFDPQIDDFAPKERNYPHFDRPLTDAQRTSFKADMHMLASHSFWPLLGFTQKERRRSKKGEGKPFKVKLRPIRFGSHQDAALLEWFGQKLSIKYEKCLARRAIRHSVLAYRSGLGSNITFANDLFKEIDKRGECICIAIDLSGFFDNISHEVLYSNWNDILKTESLPTAQYKVFRRLTKFEWVELDELKERLGRNRAVNGRLCTAKEFRTKIRTKNGSIIKTNKEKKGIPQGTPISGLLANISLYSFDIKIRSYLKRKNASYRRYSDDICIVLPPNSNPDTTVNYLEKELKNIGLEVNIDKTEISNFTRRNYGNILADRPFQYLGFTYDGKDKLIRNSSINRFYRKMTLGIKAKIVAAKNSNVPKKNMYLRKLYRDYTHFGKERNFPRYAYRAADMMDAPEIRQQLAKHMNIFKRKLRDTI